MVKAINPIDEERVRNLIQNNHWIFAKTYAKTAPHEYVCRDYLDDSMKKEFVWFVKYIREHGQPENFFNAEYIYFYFGDYKYWTMGNPIDETTIINRAISKN